MLLLPGRGSVPDVKRRKGRSGRLLNDLNVRYNREARSLAAPVDQFLQGAVFPLCHDLHPPVGKIPHPAAEIVAPCLLLRPGAEKDALDPSGHKEADAPDPVSIPVMRHCSFPD